MLTALLDAESAVAKKARADRQWPDSAVANAGPAEERGRVGHVLVDPFGQVDGLWLESGVWVTFPKHMGGQLVAEVQAGDSVDVKGTPTQQGQLKGYVITNVRTNRSVTVEPKPRNALKTPKFVRRMGLESMSAQGMIRHLRFGERGECDGLLLSDGTVVRFPTHASYRFDSLLQVGQHVTASGFGTQNKHGRGLEVTAFGPTGRTPQPIHSTAAQ